MGNSLFTYKTNSVWLHDSQASIIAYYLLKNIEEGKYASELDKIKKDLEDQLKLDLANTFSGSLDLGLEIVKENNLEFPFLETLNELKKTLEKEGEILKKEKIKVIDMLSDVHRQDEVFIDVETQEVITWVSKIEKLMLTHQ